MAPLFLLALFLTYQVSITMFTHVHIINGVMIVHSHPSSDDHHTHTAGQVITIAHIGSYQTPEPEAGVSNVTVECPLLYVLGLNTNTSALLRLTRIAFTCVPLLLIVEILKFGMKKTIAFSRKFEVFRLKELEVF